MDSQMNPKAELHAEIAVLVGEATVTRTLPDGMVETTLHVQVPVSGDRNEMIVFRQETVGERISLPFGFSRQIKYLFETAASIDVPTYGLDLETQQYSLIEVRPVRIERDRITMPSLDHTEAGTPFINLAGAILAPRTHFLKGTIAV